MKSFGKDNLLDNGRGKDDGIYMVTNTRSTNSYRFLGSVFYIIFMQVRLGHARRQLGNS